MPRTCAGSACSGSSSVYKLALASNRDVYMKHLEDFLCNCLYRADQCKEDNWQDLLCSVVWVSEKSIGCGKKRQPGWFEDSVERLTPLIDARNAAYDRLLGSNLAGARS